METKEKVVYDANKLDEVIVPAKKVEVKNDKHEYSEDDDEDESDNPSDNVKSKANDNDDTDDEEDEEEDDDVEEEKKVKSKKDDDPDDEEEEEEDENHELDSTIKDLFGEKYEITSVEELEETLDAIDALAEKAESLEKELAEAKKTPKEPKFETESHKKAFDFIKDSPKELHGERLMTWAELNNVKVDDGDPKYILRQEYIIRHPELTREEATRKFERRYEQRYTVDPDKFDDEKKLKDEEDDKKSDLKIDTAKAREFLKKQQEEFKSVPKDKEEETPEESVIVKQSVAQNAKLAESFLNKFTEIKFEDGDEKFSFKLNDKQIKEVRSGVMAWVKNPVGYNEKGELPGFDPESSAINVAMYLYSEKIIQEVWRQAKTTTAAKKIEELAGVKPSRKAKGGDASSSARSEEQQWEDLLKKKEEDKKKKGSRVAA